MNRSLAPTAPGRRTLAAAALLPLLLLASCGADEGSTNDAAASDSSPRPADTTATDAGGAGGAIEGAQEALDSMSADGILDAVGQSVVSVLSGATGYEVDGTTLYVDVDGDPEMALSNCQIVLGAASALADDPQVVLRYGGDEVDCSQF